MTFHLNLELEHTLAVRSSGDHRVQVRWRSSHLPAKNNLHKKFTDGQTDRQTDGRRAIAFAHGMS